MTVLVVTDGSSRADIAKAIRILRERAKRYSLYDQRRLDIDDEVDLLVSEWLGAEA